MGKKYLIISLIIFSLVLLTGSGGCAPATSGDGVGDKPIKLGILGELTGPGALYGTFVDAIVYRLEEVGYEVGGRPIEIIIEDTATDPATAVEKTKKLVERDGVDLLLGPVFSDAQDAIAPYLADKGILNMTLIGGSWEITEDYDNWINWPGTLESFGIPLGDYAYEQGYRNMATIGADYVAGYGIVNGPAHRFRDLGGTLYQQWIPYGTIDFAPYLANVVANNPDVLMIWTITPDILLLMKQFYEFGLDIPLLVVEAENINSEQLESVGEIILGTKGMIFHYAWNLENPLNQSFVQGFKEKYGRLPDLADGCAYNGLSVYLEALEATGGNTDMEVLLPAIKAIQIDTPSGPVALTSDGVGINNRYMAEVGIFNGRYAWVPFRTYEDVYDPRATK